MERRSSAKPEDSIKRLAQVAFATGLIALGVFGLVNGDFAAIWRSAPAWLPVRDVLARASAAVVLACGLGMLFTRTASLAARGAFPLLALMLVLLRLPVVLRHPLVEVAWQSLSEFVVISCGAWVLFAAERRPVRIAQLAFGLALIPLGVAHFVYLNLTAPLVPSWLPFHTGWAYFTGAAQVAAGLGVVFGVLARLAATLEAAMLAAFTALVWIPAVIAAPGSRPTWSEFTASWAISAGAWVVAASLPRRRSAVGQ